MRRDDAQHDRIRRVVGGERAPRVAVSLQGGQPSVPRPRDLRLRRRGAVERGGAARPAGQGDLARPGARRGSSCGRSRSARRRSRSTWAMVREAHAARPPARRRPGSSTAAFRPAICCACPRPSGSRWPAEEWSADDHELLLAGRRARPWPSSWPAARRRGRTWRRCSTSASGALDGSRRAARRATRAGPRGARSVLRRRLGRAARGPVARRGAARPGDRRCWWTAATSARRSTVCAAHLEHFRSVLRDAGPIGKRLDFLDPGDLPRAQHPGRQVPQRRDDPRRARRQGALRADARAGAERRVESGIRSVDRRASARRASCFILSAPSGAGKTTLIRSLIEARSPTPAASSSRSATRPAGRGQGEVDGKDYHFVDHARPSWRMIDGGSLPGVGRGPRQLLRHPGRRGASRAWSRGSTCSLDIDVQGAERVMERYPGGHSIFIMPPSYAGSRPAARADEVSTRARPSPAASRCRSGRSSVTIGTSMLSSTTTPHAPARRWRPSFWRSAIGRSGCMAGCKRSSATFQHGAQPRPRCRADAATRADRSAKETFDGTDSRPIDSKFRYVLVAAKRAEQLMRGARPKLECRQAQADPGGDARRGRAISSTGITARRRARAGRGRPPKAVEVPERLSPAGHCGRPDRHEPPPASPARSQRRHRRVQGGGARAAAA